MALQDPIDVTPLSTVSTLQLQNEVANTLINAVLIAFAVANINSIISKLVHLTHRNVFRYSSFQRVFIFHNSDDPALLYSWLRQALSKDPLRGKPRVFKRRLVWPFLARLAIFLATIVSIAISIPTEKRLKGCSEVDFFPNLKRRAVGGQQSIRSPDGPVCTEIPLETNLGTVRSRANYCSFPVFSEPRSSLTPVVIVRYNEKTGVLHSGVASPTGSDDIVSGQASESYVEWVDERNVNYRSPIHGWEWQQHAATILDAIQFVNNDRDCELELGSVIQKEGDFREIPVTCEFDAEKVARVVEAYIRNSLRWQKSAVLMNRIRVNGFREEPYCPIDVTVQRPLVNMLPLGLALIMLFTVNLAVSFTILERGEVLEQTFGLVKEVLGHDCTSGAIERSTDTDGIQVAEVKKWACSGGRAYHEGILKGEDCDEVKEFPKDIIATRCRYADGSGRRVVNVYQGKKNI